MPAAEGRLSFIDNAVDTATGTILLKATFANEDERLWPGQFVDVTVILGEEPDRVVCPAAAVQTGQQGQYVFVVASDRTVELRPVRVSRHRRAEAVIDEGLAAGETVVTDGQLRLVPGAAVEVKEPQAAGRREPMNISELFIRRPVMTTLVMVGDPALRRHGLPAAAGQRPAERRLPDHLGVGVAARAPAPRRWRRRWRRRSRSEFSTIAGIDSMTSSSSLGTTQITLQFDLDRDIDAAAQDVQAAIARASRQLPQDMPSPPSYQKVNPADQPILFLGADLADAAALRARRVRPRP